MLAPISTNTGRNCVSTASACNSPPPTIVGTVGNTGHLVAGEVVEKSL